MCSRPNPQLFFPWPRLWPPAASRAPSIMIFYYGHPPALYINKLRVAGLIEKPLNPYFEQLFETGADEMRWDDLSKNEMLWPCIQEDFRKDEGQLGAMLNAMVDPAIDRSRVSFRQADACSLPAELTDFDAVLLANLLCRLPSPKALLWRRVRDG